MGAVVAGLGIRDLPAEIAELLKSSDEPLTADEIARSIRARTFLVREILRTDERFFGPVESDRHVPRRFLYRLADESGTGGDGRGRPVSQCDRVLAMLADGREHEMRDIHRQVGFMRLNSRVAELRRRGHQIVCRREGGEYHYRLLLEEAEGAAPSVSSSGTGHASPDPGAPTQPEPLPISEAA